MIKRTQRLLGRVYTVSGVCSCFRHSAIHDVGYWSAGTVTEDVDISWKLQLAYWGILYEPRAVCWILVPESLRGLWRQRVRGARGMGQVLRRFGATPSAAAVGGTLPGALRRPSGPVTWHMPRTRQPE
jgi:biofilm PGA synthesis N-glycosyltransferase PgaC